MILCDMKKTPELFDSWNATKKHIEFALWQRKLFIKPWQLWWYHCGVNIATEISKDYPFKRPCLIINEYGSYGMVGIIPILWRKPNLSQKFYYELTDRQIYWLQKPSFLLLYQYQVIALKRLVQKINDNNLYIRVPIFHIKEKLKKII